MLKILSSLFLFTECSILRTNNDLDIEIKNNDFIEEYFKNENDLIASHNLDLNLDSKAEIFQEIENFLQDFDLIENTGETGEISAELITTTSPNPACELSVVERTSLKYDDSQELEIGELIKKYIGDSSISEALNQFCNEIKISEENEDNETVLINENFEQDELQSNELESGVRTSTSSLLKLVSSSKDCKDSIVYSEGYLNDYKSKKRNFNEISCYERCQTPNSKKVCNENIIIPIENTLSLNSTLKSELFKYQYKCTFLSKYDKLLTYIEVLITDYMHNERGFKDFNIDKALYEVDLCFIEGFSTNKFTQFSTKTDQKLILSSSIIGMLESFLYAIKPNIMEGIINLICVSLKLNEKFIYHENIEKSLANELITFVNSDESIYLKSICPEFISLAKNTHLLKARCCINLVKGFISFLLLLKRNFLVTPYLILKITKTFGFDETKKIIDNEILNSLNFVYTFIVFFPFKEPENILVNISSIIMLYCALLEEKTFSIKQECFDVIFTLEHLFFELKEFKIFINIIELLKVSVKGEKFIPNNKEKEEFLNIKEKILKNVFNIKEQFLEKICYLHMKASLKRNLKGGLEQSLKLSLNGCMKLLNTFNRFIIYQGYFKVRFFNFYIRLFENQNKI